MARAASRDMTAGPASSSLAPPGSAAAKSFLMAAVAASEVGAAAGGHCNQDGARGIAARHEPGAVAGREPASGAKPREPGRKGAYRVRQAITGGQRGGGGTQVAQQLLQGTAQHLGLEQPGLDDGRQQVAMREELGLLPLAQGRIAAGDAAEPDIRGQTFLHGNADPCQLRFRRTFEGDEQQVRGRTLTHLRQHGLRGRSVAARQEVQQVAADGRAPERRRQQQSGAGQRQQDRRGTAGRRSAQGTGSICMIC
jgi:hypothetical protein